IAKTRTCVHQLPVPAIAAPIIMLRATHLSGATPAISAGSTNSLADVLGVRAVCKTVDVEADPFAIEEVAARHSESGRENSWMVGTCGRRRSRRAARPGAATADRSCLF